MKRYKLKDILFPILSVVAVFLLVIYILFSMGSIFDNYEKLNKYNANIDTYNQNLSLLESFSVTNLTSKQDLLSQNIPTGGDVANLVNNVISLALSYGLNAQRDIAPSSSSTTSKSTSKNSTSSIVKTVEDLQSGDPEFVSDTNLINGLVYPISLSITVKGAKENIMQFVTAISIQQRIMSLQFTDLTFTGQDKGEWTGKFEIYSYSVLEKKADSRKIVFITDPLDPELSSPIKKVNTAL